MLPASGRLASMFDPMTWVYAFPALFPFGDAVPYLTRDVDMTLQETFAYLMAREELSYPVNPAEGSPPPQPLGMRRTPAWPPHVTCAHVRACVRTCVCVCV